MTTSAIETIGSAAWCVVPEAVLLLLGTAFFLIGPFVAAGATRRFSVWPALTLAGLILTTIVSAVVESQTPVNVAASPFRADAVAIFIRSVNLFAAIVLVLSGWQQAPRQYAAESYACLLFIVAGADLVAFANDLVSLFLALELVSIPTYVYLALNRNDLSGNEAAVKYFLLSVFSSAIFLYGLSLYFGLCGETNLDVLRTALAASESASRPLLVPVAMVFVLAGLGFRITAVPFHFYAPDVFEGSRTSTAALLAYIPKAAGFVGLLRLVGLVLPAETSLGLADKSVLAVFVIAVLTMFVGNLSALRQQNVQRLLAYSSIAHAGYMLVSLATIRSGGWTVPEQALLFYLPVYAAMTIGLFAIVTHLDRPESPLRSVQDFAGLGRTDPFLALCTTTFLLSLTGLPPTAGFLGKLLILWAAWSEGSWAFAGLAALMAVNAAIGAAYYLRIIGLMYFSPPADESAAQPAPSPSLLAALLCLVPTLGLFLRPGVLWDMLSVAGR